MKKILLVICLFLVGCTSSPFYLEDEYYDKGELIEIDGAKLDKLEGDKKSFGILIYQYACSASADFIKVMKDFTKENNITFYMIPYTHISDNSLAKEITYCPSFAIYKDGKIVSYLKADDDRDLKYYKSVKNFKEWVINYVNIDKK